MGLEVDYINRDRDLVEQAKQANQLAQYQLYQKYAKAMFNVSHRMMNNFEEAEDVLQDAFIDIFRRLHTFRYESSIGSWIKSIVINKCINALKKRKIDMFLSEDVMKYEKIDEQNMNDDQISYDVSQLRDQIGKLPEGYRVIFSLYTMEGYDHEEISQILNISVSTSKTQYMRAKNRIRESIKSQQ
ncbi:MAG: RNA polymerase sigma factor [Bacteroidetes bacterium]|nr:RNA polymerase sigma factor [Bacteroidota bacterium]MBT3421554.1 RNA polymerase sigma factor [Bacteroidota bacterium]MBT3800584.1 RNA polymerase sigma factor [Bacteroidota bacterium]MBT3935420.1 RNA polymerase sigma factor [Bacteroidota bacterium]MBT4339977.1 RNA polymerase sigma factor [Bacteroidota bacterium]